MNDIIHDKYTFDTLQVIEMLESLISQAIELNPILEYKGMKIPNLTYEYLTSDKASDELQDYYKYIVAPLLSERYYRNDEKNEIDLFKRVAESTATSRVESKLFYLIMRLRLFLPSSPTLMNAGQRKGTLSSCFVIIPKDSMRSIASYWKNMSLVQKYGGGVGTDWSALRPEGDPVMGTTGVASGFAPFLSVANEINKAIKQGSARSGANASTMRYDHPDIMKFIDFKRDDPAKFGFFNLSVTFDDKGFEKCWNNEDVDLVFGGKVYKTIKGRTILQRMAENAWLNGDPSPYFIDRVNKGAWSELVLGKTDPFGEPYGKRISHNPCGEQNLPNWGVCNLGSINLFALSSPLDGKLNDYLMRIVTSIGTVFLDNVISFNWYSNLKIEQQAVHLRNIGMGYMGLADVFYLKGINYDSPEALTYTENITNLLTRTTLKQSQLLGRILGKAPVLKGTRWKYRNTDFTCIAPTGSISLLSLCNNGIEPYFALGYKKLVYPKGTKSEKKYIDVKPPVFMMFEKKVPKTSHKISPNDHLRMLSVVSKSVTNAVSKTINMANNATVEDILQLYKKAYDLGIKSVTMFRDGSRSDLALIVAEEENDNCCAEPELIFRDGCQECLNCHWSACST